VFFDARKTNAKRPLPGTIHGPSGTIRTIVIDINPVAPSRL